MALPRVGISSCLLGCEVRYDGGHKRCHLLEVCLGPHVEWVPVCPELEVGMGVPREPVRLVAPAAASAAVHMVGVDSGADWTQRMLRFAEERVEELAGLRLGGYILKSRSPSCGLRVPLHTGRGAAASTAGLFAATLRRRFPTLPLSEEAELADAEACRRFLARLRRHERAL